MDALLKSELLAKSLIHKHVPGWKFRFTKGRKQLGQCNYNTKTIGLSRHYVLNYSEELVKDTILHEIAHALAGWEAAHGPVWKRHCLAIGAIPRARKQIEVKGHKWELKCIDCSNIHKYFRKPGRSTVLFGRCGRCRGALKLTQRGS